jgi:hypothetical protein
MLSVLYRDFEVGVALMRVSCQELVNSMALIQGIILIF